MYDGRANLRNKEKNKKIKSILVFLTCLHEVASFYRTPCNSKTMQCIVLMQWFPSIFFRQGIRFSGLHNKSLSDFKDSYKTVSLELILCFSSVQLSYSNFYSIYYYNSKHSFCIYLKKLICTTFLYWQWLTIIYLFRSTLVLSKAVGSNLYLENKF